ATAAVSGATSDAEAVTLPAVDETLLTVEGFNFDKVSQMIDGSSLSDVQKTTLKSTLDSAQSNPQLLDGALQQVKAALGL
ncbi:MAG: hypothetical protein ABJR23_20965, partial [Paracoccaceae bacterium]